MREDMVCWCRSGRTRLSSLTLPELNEHGSGGRLDLIIGVMARYPQTFGHKLYIYLICFQHFLNSMDIWLGQGLVLQLVKYNYVHWCASVRPPRMIHFHLPLNPFCQYWSNFSHSVGLWLGCSFFISLSWKYIYSKVWMDLPILSACLSICLFICLSFIGLWLGGKVILFIGYILHWVVSLSKIYIQKF